MKGEKRLQLFPLAWPIFINNILSILLGFIDVFVLSQVNDLAASAVSAACQVTSICSLIFSVVCGATSVMVALYLGKGERKKASHVSALCIVINGVLGGIVAAIVILAHDPLLQILGAKEELFHMASVYIGILAWGIPADAYNSTLNSILYSHGETRVSMYLSSGIGILNLILDIILVLGLFGCPALGVAGAAYATVISKGIYMVIATAIFFRKVESIRIFGLVLQSKWKDVWAIFSLGLPSIFDSMNYSISQLVITGIVLHYLEQTDIIARTYLMNIAMFFNLFTNALASATQIMIGHDVGAGNYERADRNCMHGMRLSLMATGMISVGAVLLSDQLFGIFTDNQQVVRIGFHLMIINVFVEMGRAMNVVFVWSLRGAGDVSIPVLIAAICMWVIAVGGAFGIVHITSLGIVGIWAVAAIDEGIRGLLMYRRWKSGKWKKRKLPGETG